VIELFVQFAALSPFAVGGVGAVLPAMQQLAVARQGWMEADEFTQLVAVSQAAPGPNVLVAALVGWKVAGLGGALAALAGFCLPAAALAWWAGGLWERLRRAHPSSRLAHALLPVALGLVAAGGWVVATPGGVDWKTLAIALAAAAVHAVTRTNPLWILAAGAAAGVLLL